MSTYARLAGVLFLVSVVVGGFGEGLAPAQLIASGDAATTVHNLVASNGLFRAGFAAYLVEALCDVALTVILFLLLRPLDRSLALFAVLFRVMATATYAFAELFYFVPSLLVSDDAYLRSFTADQVNALVLLSFKVFAVGGSMSLVFYGVGSVIVGYLIFRSGYVPGLIGLLWVLGGLSFVISTFTFVLAPTYSPAILEGPMIVAILSLALWWLLRGVDESAIQRKALSFAQSAERG